MKTRDIYPHRTYRTKHGYQLRVDDIDYTAEELVYTVTRGCYRDHSDMLGAVGRTKLNAFANRVQAELKPRVLIEQA